MKVNTRFLGGGLLNLVQILGVQFSDLRSTSRPGALSSATINSDLMSDPGGIEMYVYWHATEDLTRKPSMEVVAIPFVIAGDSPNALLVRGNFLQLQIANQFVQDTDLDKAVFGNATGYITVYPGYVSKRMEPPPYGIKTYSISWASVTIADQERSSFTISARLDRSDISDKDDFFWGRFG